MVVVPCGEAGPGFCQAEVHLALMADVCFLLDLAVVKHILQFDFFAFSECGAAVILAQGQLECRHSNWPCANWNEDTKQLLDSLQNLHPREFAGIVTDNPYYLLGEEEK